MRALWTEQEAAYDGEFVKFGPNWAWPKPVQSHIPVLVGAAGTEKNFTWIARSADGWITTPRDFDIDEPVRLLQDVWAAAGRFALRSRFRRSRALSSCCLRRRSTAARP